MRHCPKFAGMAALSLMVCACGTDVDLSKRPLFVNGVNTLTVYAYDGLTGSPLDATVLKVQVGPHTLAADTLKDAASANVYTVSQIPTGTFPVIATREGYLDFIGTVTFNGSGNLTNPGTNITYLAKYLVMYPKQAVDQDVTVKVYDGNDGAPVQGGMLVASITQMNSTPMANILTDTNVLDGSFAMRPMSIKVDLVNGAAVLPRADLVLGATYNLDVIAARNANGYLQPKEVTNFTVGTSLPLVTIFTGLPAGTPVALSATNENDKAGTTYSVTFPYPVEICTTSNASMSITTTPGTPPAIPVASSPSASAVMSGDGLVLTLSPLYTADPLTGAFVVEFAGVMVRVKGAKDCVNLDTVQLRSSSPAKYVDYTLHIR
jgi:hypothetical protein